MNKFTRDRLRVGSGIMLKGFWNRSRRLGEFHWLDSVLVEYTTPPRLAI